MSEWWVIDTATNEIVNCITTDGPEPKDVLALFDNAEVLRLDRHPPKAMLERYRYWRERP